MTTLGAGCAAPFHEDDASTESRTATSGLRIEEQRSDLVRGTFQRDGAEIGFTFRVDAEKVHHAKVWDKDGPILESKITNGNEETNYLGGRARVSGGLFDEKPVIEGEQKIFDVLNEHPSASLFFTVRDALVEAGVSKDLVSVSRKAAEPSSGITPQYRSVERYAIHPYHSVNIPTTWQAWVYTQFTLSSGGPSTWFAGCVQAQTGWSPWVCSGARNGGSWVTGARYYGYSVKVLNNYAPMSGYSLLSVHHEEL